MLTLEQVEQLARDHRCEALDPSVLEPGPLVMRARMADERIFRDHVCRERAK